MGYTDPNTKQIYKWNASAQQWCLKDGSVNNSSVTIQGNNSATYTDPSSNITYNWNTEKGLWVSEDGKTLYPNSYENQPATEDDKFQKQWGEISESTSGSKPTNSKASQKTIKKKTAP